MARVLVIDDQKDVRTVMRMVLKVHRFEVVEAETAAAGLRAFAEGLFDVVLVDICLEDASGLEVVAQMRASVPTQPIVVVSGIAALDTQNELPADVVRLQKPFRPSDLIAAVTRVWDQGRVPQRIAV